MVSKKLKIKGTEGGKPEKRAGGTKKEISDVDSVLLEDIFDPERYTLIHLCDKKEYSEFCSIMHKLGRRRANGKSYLQDPWEMFKEFKGVDVARGGWWTNESIKENRCMFTVLEFSAVKHVFDHVKAPESLPDRVFKLDTVNTEHQACGIRVYKVDGVRRRDNEWYFYNMGYDLLIPINSCYPTLKAAYREACKVWGIKEKEPLYYIK